MTKWYDRPIPDWLRYTILAVCYGTAIAIIVSDKPSTLGEWFHTVGPMLAGALGAYIAVMRRAARKRIEDDHSAVGHGPN